MALALRVLNRNFFHINKLTKPVRWSVESSFPLRVLSSSSSYNFNYISRYSSVLNTPRCPHEQCRLYTTSSTPDNSKREPDEKKPNLFQRFKQMYRDYWYVLLPVHGATSVFWFAGFYYAVRSGFDVVGLLEYLGVSEKLLQPLRDSTAGYFAFAFALYKLATPLRYTVTVGSTTYAINKLTAIGWIKPVPSSTKLKEMLQVRKDNLQDRFNESKIHYQIQMKEKKSKVMDEMRRYRTEMRTMKNKVKKTESK